MEKFYWYQTSKVPRLEFKWLRSKSPDQFYVGFNGPLSERELDQSNAVELGVMTLKQFESKYGNRFGGL